MAITRRQFVATLGSMAAALGLSQADLAKVTESFALSGVWAGGKPKVIWVHGAECTGCSTSLLSLFEDARENAIIDPHEAGYGTKVIDALGLVADGAVPRSLEAAAVGGNFDMNANNAGVPVADQTGAYIVNIADVLIDFLDLQYHETVMGPGGDLAHKMLLDNMNNDVAAKPFVLVVEGAVQVHEDGGAWSQPATHGDANAAWCSVGIGADGTNELEFDKVVAKLASKASCKAVISIGQCACYGGYPAAVSPNAQFAGKSQTPAYGVYDYLASHSSHYLNASQRAAAAGKVVNCPGCPTNPWWFVLSVVLWLVDATTGPLKGGNGALGIVKSDWSLNGAAVDYGRRLKKVYGTPIHGPACPRYTKFTAGQFAAHPGDSGCLMKIGCKGISTKSLCPLHGWNSQQPQNDATWESGLSQFQGSKQGTFCVSAGHPCMGCTEKGYPDAQVPFVKLF